MAVAVVSWAMLAASVVVAGADQDAAVELVPVVPPGQEALIAGMLGRGAALPDCTLVSCGVDHTVIEATYRCVDGDVTLAMGHPRNAPAQTAQFAVTVQSGTASPDLQNALVSLVRARERDFVWGWAEVAADVENDDAAE